MIPFWVFYIIQNSCRMTSAKKVQINTRKFICVSVEVGWLSQISGSVAKLSPLPSTISFGATTFIYQRKQKMSNGNNSGDWHQFIFRTWLWQLLEFFPPGDGGLHFAKKLFLFLSAHKMWPYSECLLLGTNSPFCSWATCKHTKRHLWGRHFSYMIPFDFSHGLGSCFSYPLQQGQKWKIWIYFILFFAPSISSNTFLLPAPLKYGSARSGQELRQPSFLFFFSFNEYFT